MSYQGIINRNGFGLVNARTAIKIVYEIRHQEPIGINGDYHPFIKKSISKHPFVVN